MKTKRKFSLNSADEEAAIQRGIAEDQDNPEWTRADFAEAKPVADAMPQLMRPMRVRGPQKLPTKIPTSMRFDSDLIEKLRAGGPGWQQRVNDILRKSIG